MITLINTQTRFLIGELYTFTLLDGTQAYYSGLDLDINYGGNTYVSTGLRIEGLKYKIAVGWEVDEQQIKISAFPGETLAGADFFGAVAEGLLDGAYITRQRGFWKVNTGIAYQDYAQAPVAVVTLFTGLVSAIDKIGRTHVEMKLKSPLKLLDIDMPRNAYSPGCLWSLYDSGCTLARSSYTSSFVVSTASQTQIVPTTAISPVTGADGIEYYLQGRLLFTSGVNENVQVLVAGNDAGNFYLQYPLNNVPSPGDTFTVSAGCTKMASTCSAKFGNLANFRGFPKVPPEMISL